MKRWTGWPNAVLIGVLSSYINILVSQSTHIKNSYPAPIILVVGICGYMFFWILASSTKLLTPAERWIIPVFLSFVGPDTDILVNAKVPFGYLLAAIQLIFVLAWLPFLKKRIKPGAKR